MYIYIRENKTKREIKLKNTKMRKNNETYIREHKQDTYKKVIHSKFKIALKQKKKMSKLCIL